MDIVARYREWQFRRLIARRRKLRSAVDRSLKRLRAVQSRIDAL